MVGVVTSPNFEKDIKHIKDKAIKERIAKVILKIKENPELGKPLRYKLKGERTVRISHSRLIYDFADKTIFLLRFEHRDKVYRKIR